MSYDYDTRLKPCDHLQRRERMIVSSEDFRTLLYAERTTERMRAPISAKGSVKMFIRGVEVPRNHAVYAWEILADELSVRSDQKSKIVFRQPVRTTETIELEYITIPAYCLKCNGYSKTNDFSVNKGGTFLRVSNYDKLVQRIYKFLLTSECAFYPSFTCKLKEFVGKKFGLSLSEDDISYECMNSLDNLKRIQIAQRSIQTLTPQEVLKEVESITTIRDQYDPTIVKTDMRVAAFGIPRSVPLSFTIRTNK
jgi:hypothetical protein